MPISSLLISLSSIWKPLIEILILWYVIYQIMLFFEGSKAVQAIRGIIILLVCFMVFQKLDFEILDWLLNKLFAVSVIAIFIVLSIGLISCSGSKQPGSTTPVVNEPEVKELNGAGATFPAVLYQKWFDVYYNEKGIKVNYQAIGSGGGIQQLTEKTVDFGGTDAPMNNEEESKAGAAIIHVPTTLGAVVITYNLPNNPKLKFFSDIVQYRTI